MKTRNVDGLMIGGFYENDQGPLIRETISAVTEELQQYDKFIGLSGPGRPLDIVFAAQKGVTHFETMWPFKLASEGKAIDIDFTKFVIEKEKFEDAEFVESEIDLNEEQFRYQQGPIVEGCDCMTCKQHHRGYIYHLLSVKEMTGNTLISIHNTHAYEQILKFLSLLKQENNLQFAYSTFVKSFCLSKIE